MAVLRDLLKTKKTGSLRDLLNVPKVDKPVYTTSEITQKPSLDTPDLTVYGSGKTFEQRQQQPLPIPKETGMDRTKKFFDPGIKPTESGKRDNLTSPTDIRDTTAIERISKVESPTLRGLLAGRESAYGILSPDKAKLEEEVKLSPKAFTISTSTQKAPEYLEPITKETDITYGQIGKGLGELEKQLMSYGLASGLTGATKLSGVGGKVAEKVPATLLGKKLPVSQQFVSGQITDLMIDNVAQAPGRIIKAIEEDMTIGEQAKQFALGNLADVAFNLVIGGSVEGIKNLLSDKKALKTAIETKPEIVDALKQNAPEQLQAVIKSDPNIAKTLEVQPVDSIKRLDDILQPVRQEPKTNVWVDDLEFYDPQSFEVVKKMFGDTDGYMALNYGGRRSEAAKAFEKTDKFKNIVDDIKKYNKSKLDPAKQTTPKLQPTRQESTSLPLEAPKQDFELNIPISKTTEPTLPKAQGLEKERGFSRNVRTDEAMQKEVRESFEALNENYTTLGNKETLDSAQNRFAQGYEQALEDFDRTKNTFRADNVPLSRLIANEAARRGDIATARRVISETAETLTTAGQFSQAARILRESNDPSTVLKFVEKEIDRLNTSGAKRYGKKWNDINLTDEELKKIGKFTADTTDAEKEAVFQELFESIAQKIPTTNREKFDSFRRMSMLGNPKTHVRNIVGNSIMAGIKKLADTVAVGGEKLLVPLEKRTKSLSVNKDVKNIASDYWEKNAKDLSEGSRWEVFGVQSPFADKRIFDNEILESLNDISKKTLEGEDIFFLKRHFVNDLAGFMQARGIKEPTQEAVDYALRRAQEATFRETNALADMISKGKSSRYGLILEAAVPFSKTPANILKTGIDYSPAGLGKAVTQLVNKAEPEVFVETMSKGLTGTGLAMLGYYLSKNGMARGDYKRKGKEEQALQLAGELPNSIKMPNGSYTIDWAQPASMPLFMGVAFAEALEKENPDLLDAGFEAMIAGGDSLVNASMLRGIKDLFGGNYGSTTEKALGLPLDYIGQAVPTVLGQVARTTDPVKRQRDYSGILPEFKTSLQAKTPSILPLLPTSKDLPAKRGLLGEELTYGTGATNALQQFLSPGFVGRASDDRVAQEIVKVYNEIGSDFLPRNKVGSLTYEKTNYDLTTAEQSEFQKVMGEYTKKEIDKLLDKNSYNRLTAEQKGDRIKDINDEGYKKAKFDYLKSKGLIK